MRIARVMPFMSYASRYYATLTSAAESERVEDAAVARAITLRCRRSMLLLRRFRYAIDATRHADVTEIRVTPLRQRHVVCAMLLFALIYALRHFVIRHCLHAA